MDPGGQDLATATECGSPAFQPETRSKRVWAHCGEKTRAIFAFLTSLLKEGLPMRCNLPLLRAGVTVVSSLRMLVIWLSPGTIFFQTHGESIVRQIITTPLSEQRMVSRGGLRAIFLRNSGRI